MKKYLVIAGAAGALVAAWSLPSLAASSVQSTVQATTPAGSMTAGTSSSVTLDQVDPNKPFGDLTIDQSKQPADIYASLNDQQRKDLQTRCALIVPNPDKFGGGVPTWCQSYLDWQKANYPNQ